MGGVLLTALVTAGATREHLDDVRYLTNGSSGRMGYAIAAALRTAGCRVHLVSGPVELEPPAGVEVHFVTTALEMLAVVERLFAGCDLVFAVAAVADYRPRTRVAGKPAKSIGGLQLELVPNPDIIATLGANKGAKTLVGFALESAPASESTQQATQQATTAALARGRDKLRKKGLDMIVVNWAPTIGAHDISAWVLGADGSQEALPRLSKAEFAAQLVTRAMKLAAGRQARPEDGHE